MKYLIVIYIVLSSTLTIAETYEVEALQEVVYHEARGEGFEGMVAVAQVIMNRVRHKKFPDTIHEVRSQNKQFSYYSVPFKLTMKERKSELKALLISVGVYTGIYKIDKFTNSVLYHVCQGKRKVKPKWDWKKLRYDGRLGNHCFYSYKT